MSRVLHSPQVVMTPSRGHGANLSSRDGMVPQDLLSVVSRRRGLVATVLMVSLLGAFAGFIAGLFGVGGGLTTHDAGGVTVLDFVLAEAMERFAAPQ